MKKFLSAGLRGLSAVTFIIFLALAVPALRAADGLPAIDKPAVSAPVTLTDNGGAWGPRQRHCQGDD